MTARIDTATALRLYYTGLTVAQVAARTGHRPEHMRKHLAATGNPMRDDRHTNSGQYRAATPTQITEILTLRGQGLTYRAIAARVGLGTSGVRKLYLRHQDTNQEAAS